MSKKPISAMVEPSTKQKGRVIAAKAGLKSTGELIDTLVHFVTALTITPAEAFGSKDQVNKIFLHSLNATLKRRKTQIQCSDHFDMFEVDPIAGWDCSEALVDGEG